MSVTLSLTVTEEFEARIREKVESGLYHSEAEVLEEALRLLDEHEQLQSLRAKIVEGLEGDSIPFTPETRAAAWERARRRAAAGENPGPDVAPANAVS